MAKFKAVIPLAMALMGLSGALLPQVSPVLGSAYAAPMVPNFELKQAGTGKTIKLSDFKGKVLVIDFWATWCPPCRAEIPHFIAMNNALKKKGVQIIGISVDSNGNQAVVPFMKAHHMNYPVLLANDQVISDFGGIRGIPTTFIVDRHGHIVQKFVGLPADTEAGINAAFMHVIHPLI